MFLFGRLFTIHANHYFPSCMTALKFSISFISLGERKHFLNNRFYLGIKKRDGIKVNNAVPVFFAYLFNLSKEIWANLNILHLHNLIGPHFNFLVTGGKAF